MFIWDGEYTIFFYHFNKIKKVMIANNLLWKRIVISVCNAIFAKFAKYYSRTENDGGLINNLVNVLDFTIKLDLYKVWDRQKNAFSTHYQNRYKKKFCEYFRKHYENSIINPKPTSRKTQNINEIMFCGNSIVILLIVF